VEERDGEGGERCARSEWEETKRRGGAGRALLGSRGVWDGVRPCFATKKTAAPVSPRPCGAWQIGMGAAVWRRGAARPVCVGVGCFRVAAARKKKCLSRWSG
jgi:hypothetical protein